MVPHVASGILSGILSDILSCAGLGEAGGSQHPLHPGPCVAAVQAWGVFEEPEDSLSQAVHAQACD